MLGCNSSTKINEAVMKHKSEIFLATILIFINLVKSPIFAQSEDWQVPEGFAVDRVVSDLFLPVNLAFVPEPGPETDAPLYYITELYGKVKVILRNNEVQVYADSLLNFTPSGQFPGTGEIGLSGIVVEPASGDIIVTMAYEDEDFQTLGLRKNRVVRLSSIDGGHSANAVSVLLDNIPGLSQGQYASHQIHTASIGPDDKLYVQTGDGFVSNAAQDDSDLRGKILRMNLDGSIPGDNPTQDSYVYAKGFRNPFGGAWRPDDNLLYISDNGPDRDDRLVKVFAGANAGWPNNLNSKAIKLWNPTTAPTAVAFCNGAGFPENLQGRLFVGLSGPTYHFGQTNRGKRIEMFELASDGSVVSEEVFLNYAGNGYPTVVGLAFGSDGLYFTDLYGENGFDGNGITHSNVYRVSYDPSTRVTDDETSTPFEFTLAQNYPNPFNPQTTIKYELRKDLNVTLTIHNSKGQKIATLINEKQSAGRHKIIFNGDDLTSGVYLYTIRAGEYNISRKMILIK